MANFKDFHLRIIRNLKYDGLTEKRYHKDKFLKYPIIIKRQKDGTNLSTNVKCNKDFKEHSEYGPHTGAFFQKFIIAKGSRIKEKYHATFVRVVFHSRNSNDPKANYGFRIRNKIEILDDEAKGLTQY